MVQEAEKMGAVRSQSSPPQSPSSVIKPQAPADVDAGPLYSGYALTPGIQYDMIRYDLFDEHC